MGRRAPLIWLLLPLVAGHGAATGLPAQDAVLAVAAVFVVVGALAVLMHPPGSFASVAFLLVAGVLGWLIASASAPPRASPTVWPLREAYLKVELTRIFATTRLHQYSGLGRVVGTPPHLQDLLETRLYWSTWSTVPPVNGAVWQMRGLLSALPASSPESLDFDRWLEQRGIAWTLRRAEVVKEESAGAGWRRRQATARLRLERILRAGEPQGRDAGVLVAATLLGRRELLPKETKARYLTTGTLHLFAVSGLHVGSLGALLAAMGSLARLPRPVIALLVVSGAGAYAWVTGGAPSSVRAFLLVTFLVLASALERPAGGWPALVAAATAVLILSPEQFHSTGFRLSYTVVAGLVLLGHPWSRALLHSARRRAEKDTCNRAGPAWLHRSRLWLSTAFVYSLAATTVGAPLAVQSFEIFAPGAVALNLVLLPMAGLLVTGGLSSVLLNLAGAQGLSRFLNGGNFLLVEAMDATTRAAAHLEGWAFHHRAVDSPAFGSCMTLVVLLMLMLLGPQRLENNGWARWLPVLTVVLGITLGTRPI